jgi:hypothetical protein
MLNARWLAAFCYASLSCLMGIPLFIYAHLGVKQSLGVLEVSVYLLFFVVSVLHVLCALLILSNLMYVSAAACPSVRRHSFSETFLSLQLYIYVAITAIWSSVCLSPCLFQMARREHKWCRQKCFTAATGLCILPSGLWILWAGSAASCTPYSINRHTGALLVETSGTRRPATINGKEEGLGVEFKEVLFDGISISESGNLAVVLACKIMTSLRLSYLRALAVCKHPSHSASVT